MRCYTERNNNDLSFQYEYLKGNSRTFYKYNYLSVSLENLVLHSENGSFFQFSSHVWLTDGEIVRRFYMLSIPWSERVNDYCARRLRGVQGKKI